ncbi:hypothetical protein ACFOZ1_09425 [Gracilibacillus marinus]|jgi:hypothetical protein|uniref:Phage holin family protein n=1 Tax=Gracilibacillus marinus TaxID=630535 RepID=A0ABV8VU52_9BACI
MFQFRGFIQAIGVSLLLTLVYGFIIGMFNLLPVEWVVITTFLLSYGAIGVFAPLWNKKTPYFATFLAAIVFTVINILFSVIVLRIPVLFNPIAVNENLISSSVMALVTACIFMQINKRIERTNNDQN